MRFVVGAPEQLFGVSGLTCLADGSVTATIPSGRWLCLQETDGTGTLGALGLLADTVFGHANHVAAPPGRDWSVTTELGLDLVSAVPLDGGDLVALGRAVGGGRGGALARGEVIAQAGAVIAIGTERGRFVADGPPAEALESGAIDHGETLPALPSVSSLRDLVGGPPGVDGRLSLHAGPRIINPLGNLHGGISVALADLAASTLVAGAWITTSIRVVYLRPLVGGDGVEVVAHAAHRGRSLTCLDVEGRRQSDGALVFTGRVVRELGARSG